MRSVFILSISLALLLTAWNPARAIVPVVIAKAGEVLVWRADRASSLRKLPIEQRAALCGRRQQSWSLHEPETTVSARRQPGQDLAWTLMRAAAVALAFDDHAAKRAIVDNLAGWAKQEALHTIEPNRKVRAYYNLDRTLLPMIASFSIVRHDPQISALTSAQIEAWLNRLVDRRRGPLRFDAPNRNSSRNNHRYLADSVTMAWGAFRGNAVLFRTGLDRFRAALGQVRSDGSLPLETARGEKALHYQRHAVASLTVIAEIAATQGIDLYRLKGNRGQKLADMVRFLADAIDKPQLLDLYTSQAQDLGFLKRRGHGRHYMAWLEAYTSRTPQRGESLRLLRAIDRFGHNIEPMTDDYVGGVATCLFRPIAGRLRLAGGKPAPLLLN